MRYIKEVDHTSHKGLVILYLQALLSMKFDTLPCDKQLSVRQLCGYICTSGPVVLSVGAVSFKTNPESLGDEMPDLVAHWTTSTPSRDRSRTSNPSVRYPMLYPLLVLSSSSRCPNVAVLITHPRSVSRKSSIQGHLAHSCGVPVSSNTIRAREANSHSSCKCMSS